jgi:hypothetical protein
LITVNVMPWAPEADATLPWFFKATEKATEFPADGLPGVQLTAAAIRSELATGVTTSGPDAFAVLFPSFCSMTVFDSSTFALRA